ncbi:hypothetical protein DFA_09585 [Cavenderia fasciculata]|uniref:Uncharacterized protein n=1 Tax=Cavenderia fasciculata TaxID=261658 RepID=F4Q814_CACFS|nr:uncharacterized protein DFA_09585 [Cavenderia fasciculata]EGG15914.1 hypothetical protein DFA_09585 [Cavenderia fasciculata]|eukprot:XP_004352239.1 hypothetical protein DFA_09585 [Cavenderia fasciculata]
MYISRSLLINIFFFVFVFVTHIDHLNFVNAQSTLPADEDTNQVVKCGVVSSEYHVLEVKLQLGFKYAGIPDSTLEKLSLPWCKSFQLSASQQENKSINILDYLVDLPKLEDLRVQQIQVPVSLPSSMNLPSLKVLMVHNLFNFTTLPSWFFSNSTGLETLFLTMGDIRQEDLSGWRFSNLTTLRMTFGCQSPTTLPIDLLDISFPKLNVLQITILNGSCFIDIRSNITKLGSLDLFTQIGESIDQSLKVTFVKIPSLLLINIYGPSITFEPTDLGVLKNLDYLTIQYANLSSYYPFKTYPSTLKIFGDSTILTTSLTMPSGFVCDLSNSQSVDLINGTGILSSKNIGWGNKNTTRYNLIATKPNIPNQVLTLKLDTLLIGPRQPVSIQFNSKMPELTRQVQVQEFGIFFDTLSKPLAVQTAN